MNILEKIVNKKHLDIKHREHLISLESLKNNLNNCTSLRKSKFKDSLISSEISIIAEIKKGSPSAGIISNDFNPVKKALEYEKFGASALSILTEEHFFYGSDKHLKEVREVTKLPILRKDFLISKYQIYESKLLGADCILLIASILDDKKLLLFSEIAGELGLDFIIEVHNEEELRRAEKYKNAIIGVNNRNLKTFETDIKNSIKLKEIFNGQNVFVSESGIKSKDDINFLTNNGIYNFLIGESLMRNEF